jgi:ABC-type iron transport system FetAB ATPase subunit
MTIQFYNFTPHILKRIAFTIGLDKDCAHFICSLLLKFVARMYKVSIIYVQLYLTETCSKKAGKQWQTTPKNLLRMQRTRAIPVA